MEKEIKEILQKIFGEIIDDLESEITEGFNKGLTVEEISKSLTDKYMKELDTDENSARTLLSIFLAIMEKIKEE